MQVLFKVCRFGLIVDFSVDISPIMPTQVSIKSSHPDVTLQGARGITPTHSLSFSCDLGMPLSNTTKWLFGNF
ncbi:unnamed protein product [Cuscuta campestris]|uniref:Uncharacterized protein n=1 Tax=Cuscuta campestris TaxID=132261 RepID=A0A484LVC5_9ASTE|nr:unnamed protein product [Cuscuta campestris]